MNFETDLLPLLSDIDRVLTAVDATHFDQLDPAIQEQQRVLCNAKDFLVYLKEEMIKESESPAPVGTATTSEPNAIAQYVGDIIQSLQSHRTEWLGPIQQELEQLTAQKQSMEREIYRLNQQYSSLVADLPNKVMGNFQELLEKQLSKAVELFEHRLRTINSVTQETAEISADTLLPDMSDRLAKWHQTQEEIDTSLVRLDGTLRSVFRTLEQDAKSYELSLSDSLARLHGLGEKTVLLPEPSSSNTETTVTPPRRTLTRRAALGSPARNSCDTSCTGFRYPRGPCRNRRTVTFV